MEHPQKYLLAQRRETKNKLNPGHFGGRRGLSQLPHPCSIVIRTSAKSRNLNNNRELTEKYSHYYGLALQKTLTRGPKGFHKNRRRKAHRGKKGRGAFFRLSLSTLLRLLQGSLHYLPSHQILVSGYLLKIHLCELNSTSSEKEKLSRVV